MYFHLFAFCFINLIPSDPAEVALRVRQVPVITEEAVQEVRSELGLDKPFFSPLCGLGGELRTR